MTTDIKKAIAYNKAQQASGAFTDEMIALLVEHWQKNHGLTADGLCGPATQRSILPPATPAATPVTGGGKVTCWPLRATADGRLPRVTSGHSSVNPSRSTHHGADMFYPYDAAVDEPIYAALHPGKKVPTRDGGAAAKNGTPRWWIPDNTAAVAVADGIIVSARDSGTGHVVWIDIGGGLLAGYFHLSKLLTTLGATVKAGDPVGIIGDNPSGTDPRHLHWEIYRGEATKNGGGIVGYPHGSLNPEPFLKGALYLPAA